MYVFNRHCWLTPKTRPCLGFKTKSKLVLPQRTSMPTSNLHTVWGEELLSLKGKSTATGELGFRNPARPLDATPLASHLSQPSFTFSFSLCWGFVVSWFLISASLSLHLRSFRVKQMWNIKAGQIWYKLALDHKATFITNLTFEK